MLHDRIARSAPPLRPGNLLPARELGLTWGLLALIALLAWLITIAQASDMGIGPGTMGTDLPLFLALWLCMMTAMMLPSVAPVAITWIRGISRQANGLTRTARITAFTGGYLVVWTTFGILAYVGLAAVGDLVDAHPDTGRWIGAGAFLLAGAQQLGPLKDVCLRHCRSPMGQLMRYTRFRPWARDLRVGIHHGLYCLGCCWGLMLVLIPLGVMNVAAMAALAAVIFVEKLWRHGPLTATVVGATFLVLACLAPFQDWLLPGLNDTGPSMDQMR